MSGRPAKYRRLFALGCAIVIGALAVGVGLWVAGTTQLVDASSAVQMVEVRNETTIKICTLVGASPPCYLYGYGDSEGVAYVAPGNLYVFSFTSYPYPTNDSAVVELSGGNLQSVTETPIPCALSPPPEYPGSGEYVFLPCGTKGNAEIVVFNWSSASIAGIIPTPTSDPYDIDVAFDPTMATAYAAVGEAGEAGHLLTISMVTLTVLANVSLPPLAGVPQVWSTGASDKVVVGAIGGSSLFQIDPMTATVGQGIDLGGTIRNFGVDPPEDRLVVCIEPSGSPYSAEFLEFATQTLAQLTAVTIPAPPGATGPSFVADSDHEDLYVDWSDSFPADQVLAVNESTGQIVGSFFFPAAIAPLNGVGTYDPLTDTLSFAGLNANLSVPIEPLMATVSLEHGTGPQVSYSAFPVLGTSLPLVVAGAGLIVGITLVVIARARDEPKGPATSTVGVPRGALSAER